MSVETLEDHGPGSRTTSRGPVPRLLALPRNYPIAWAIGWTVLLLGLTLAPQRILPNEKSILSKAFYLRADLAVHFTLFVGFAWSWIRATRAGRRWVVVAAVGVMLAIGTEWAQGASFIDRDPDVADALADCTGAAAGLAAAAVFRSRPAPKTELCT
jgi:VanZ family protein